MKKKYSKDSGKVIQIDETEARYDFPSTHGQCFRTNKPLKHYLMKRNSRR